ncbi:MAG: aquaporin [Planctomycetia bacterium]
MTESPRRTLAAEAFGTFALVFAGTGAIVINEASGGTITHVGIAITFGLIVLAMIYAIGDVSGCHLNPAVTFGFYAARRFEGRMVVPYIVAQCVGAVIASVVLKLMFPTNAMLGATEPAGGATQSFVLEFLLTLILMFVILSVSVGAKEKGLLAGVAIGAVIALEAMFAGPISGASMNPARSLAPALLSLRLEHLWLYLAAPILGAIVSVAVWRCVQAPGCCGGVVAKGLNEFNGHHITVTVTMGCGDECPLVRADQRVDWKIPDPRDMTPEEFRGVCDLIEQRVKDLLADLEASH